MLDELRSEGVLGREQAEGRYKLVVKKADA
jgi:hypothetical protein